MCIKLSPSTVQSGAGLVSLLCTRNIKDKTVKLVKIMDPVRYISFHDVQTCNVSNLIDEFEEDLIQMSGKCMDIGCGPGDVTREILLPALNPNATIIGTDISKNMIEFAKKTHDNEERLKFEVLNIQTKNLPKKYVSGFDHVFSFHTLNWCYDIRHAFENIYHILRPGGSILMSLAASHDTYEVLKIFARDSRFEAYIQDVREYISPFHDSTCPRKELRTLLESIGFEIYHCSLREVSSSGKVVENLLSSVIALYPFLDKMPYNRKEEFVNEFISEFKKKKMTYKIMKNNQEQTLVLDIHTLLIIHARKV